MKTLLCALAVVLSAPAALGGEPDWVEHRIGDLGVVLPTGNGWAVSELDAGALMALRVHRTPAGDPQLIHGVLFEQHEVPEIYADWLPVELATDYLLWEIAHMRTEGVNTGEYDLTELDVYEEPHGEFTLHVLHNVKDYIEPRYENLALEAQELYLVFLPDFAATTTFYKIFIGAHCYFEACTVDDLDLSGMYPLLDDLRDYSAASD